jgi:hypothetical protein
MQLVPKFDSAASREPRFKVGEEVLVDTIPQKHTRGVVEEMYELAGPPFKPGIWLKVRERDNNFRWVHQSLVSPLSP